MHVLRYEPGQKYEAHMDSCFMLDFQGQQVSEIRNSSSGNDIDAEKYSQPRVMSTGCEQFLVEANGPNCGQDGGVTCGDR